MGFLNYPDSRKKKKITLTKEKERDLFEIIDIEDRFPVERVNKLLNDKE